MWHRYLKLYFYNWLLLVQYCSSIWLIGSICLFCLIINAISFTYLQIIIVTQSLFKWSINKKNGFLSLSFVNFREIKCPKFVIFCKIAKINAREIFVFQIREVKVAQNSFQLIPRHRFWCVIITNLYQLMLQSCYQKTAQSLVNTLGLFSWHNRLP